MKALLAPLVSPALTGTPTAPTAAAGTASTQLATTAYADRAAAANAARTAVADVSYTVLPTDRTIAVTALTAARTLTLPAASAYPLGVTLRVVDESGAASPTNTITLAAAGTDAIDGAPSAILAVGYGTVALQSNGAGAWTLVAPPTTMAVTNSGSTNNAATGSGAFVAMTPTVPLPPMPSGKAYRVLIGFRLTSGSATSQVTTQLRLGSTVIGTIVHTPSSSLTAVTYGFTFVFQTTAAPSGATNVETTVFGNLNTGTASTSNQTAQPVAVATNALQVLSIATMWASAGTGTNAITLSQLIVEPLN